MAEEVKAEVIGEAASPQDIMRFDLDRIGQDVLAMSQHIMKAQAYLDVYAGTDLEEVGDADLTRYVRDINSVVNDYESARKQLKKDCMAPYDEVEAKGKELMEPLKSVQRVYKAEQDSREQARKDAKESELRQEYADYAPFLVDVVPYEVFADRAWLNKTCSMAHAVKEMHAIVDGIAKDWEALKAAELAFPEEAEAQFFRTLSLGDALAYDKRRKDEAERIARLHENVEGVTETTRVPVEVGNDVEVPVEEPPMDMWADGEVEVIDAHAMRCPVAIAVELSDYELEDLVAWFKARNASGRFGKAPQYDSAEGLWVAVKAVVGNG